MINTYKIFPIAPCRQGTNGPLLQTSSGQIIPHAGEKAAAEQKRIAMLVEALTNCLAELDEIEALVPATHVESALYALRKQFYSVRKVSDTD